MPIRSGDVININIPALSAGEPKGVKVVPQSTGGLHEYYIAQKDEQNQTLFQLAGAPTAAKQTQPTPQHWKKAS